MKAVVIHAANDLRIETRKPDILKPGQARISIQAGGICGSDLHYFQHGGIGAIRVREPMILGHEVAGVVTESLDETGRISVGDRVAVSPSRPCHDCKYCAEKQFNHCLNMRFFGSAMPMPHIQGAFCEDLVADLDQCFVITPDIPVEIAAFAEPLSVVLHGLKRADSVAGKRVLVTGCGPIGALCVLAAKAAGAAEIVVTDVIDHVLDIASKLGADRAINVAQEPNWVADYNADKGHFDLMLEASGNAAAFAAGFDTMRPRGILVQLGLGGDMSIPVNTLVAKEIDMRGSFRFHEEFGAAVDLINAGTLNLEPLLTARFPIERVNDAFALAGDRTRAMKVQLDFTTSGQISQ